MGALLSFCSDAEESEKPKVLGDAPSEDSNTALEQQPHQHEENEVESQQATLDTTSNKNEAERALKEEQARLELIVSTAGRGMVAVRSTRANPGYYDQGFAAALAQHLQEQIGASSTLPNTLPTPSPDIDVYATLNSAPNVNSSMDHVAESFLASMIPTSEHLFNQVGPMVENLL
jgi:hypothetical protein